MKWLKRIFARGDQNTSPAFLLDIRCDKCGEVIQVRVDPRYELREDVQDGREVRALDKDVMGTRCFALIHVHAVLASDLTVLAQEVTGGELVSVRPVERHDPGKPHRG
jgi:hypothetical protein